MSLKLDHIGHVVKDYDAALDFYKNAFGVDPEFTLEFKNLHSKMAFFSYGGTIIEMIKPGSGENDPAARCLKERGEGVFHLSFRVDDYEAEVKKWKDKGFTVDEMVNEANGVRARLAFLRPEEMFGLYIELIKEEKM
jgi:methylmalonyl-CoA/ethylmalonyl-CoA epimerase